MTTDIIILLLSATGLLSWLGYLVWETRQGEKKILEATVSLQKNQLAICEAYIKYRTRVQTLEAEVARLKGQPIDVSPPKERSTELPILPHPPINY